MAGTQRYLRYTLIAFLCLITVYFFSSAAHPRRLLQPINGSTKQNEADDQEARSAPSSTPRATSIEQSAPKQSGDQLKSATAGQAVSKAPKPRLPTPPAPGQRENATFVTLARNADIWDLADSIRQVEDRFNRKFNYDWVFLNDEPFDETFKRVTTALVSGKTRYGKIPREHWGFPEWIDLDKAAQVREEMRDKEIIYGDSISYRHMCRYESGFFFHHPILLEYEWYWRVEPSIKMYCDVDYDTFKFMRENKKVYSFVISLFEYEATIPTIWDSVKGFMKSHPEHIVEGNAMKFVSDNKGKDYNLCHFWSNFEIGSLTWLRSQAYTDYFNKLDRDGGFYYERWGDAPVHSIAAAILLKKEEIHFFNDIAYWHVPFTHCPTGEEYRIERKCSCKPEDNFDWNAYSCTKRWYKLNDMKLPEGWQDDGSSL